MYYRTNVIFHFLMEMLLVWYIYVLHVIRFARVCSNVSDFKQRNQIYLQLLNKVINIINFVKLFFNSTTDTPS